MNSVAVAKSSSKVKVIIASVLKPACALRYGGMCSGKPPFLVLSSGLILGNHRRLSGRRFAPPRGAQTHGLRNKPDDSEAHGGGLRWNVESSVEELQSAGPLV